MKKLATLFFGLVLMGCAHTPEPAPKVPAQTSAEMEAIFFREKVLSAMNRSVYEKCEQNRDPENQLWREFCFCVSRVITNSIRQDPADTNESVGVCVQEAFHSAIVSVLPGD